MGLAFQISRGLRANLRANLHTGPSLGPHRQPPPGLPLHKGEVHCHPLSGEGVRLGSSVEPMARSALLSPAKGRHETGSIAPSSDKGGEDWLIPPQPRRGMGRDPLHSPLTWEEWGRYSLPCQGEGRGGVRGVFSSAAGAPSGSGRAWCHPPAPAPRPPARRGRCGSPPPRRCVPCRRCTRRWHPPLWWGWWRGSAP